MMKDLRAANGAMGNRSPRSYAFSPVPWSLPPAVAPAVVAPAVEPLVAGTVAMADLLPFVVGGVGFGLAGYTLYRAWVVVTSSISGWPNRFGEWQLCQQCDKGVPTHPGPREQFSTSRQTCEVFSCPGVFPESSHEWTPVGSPVPGVGFTQLVIGDKDFDEPVPGVNRYWFRAEYVRAVGGTDDGLPIPQFQDGMDYTMPVEVVTPDLPETVPEDYVIPPQIHEDAFSPAVTTVDALMRGMRPTGVPVDLQLDGDARYVGKPWRSPAIQLGHVTVVPQRDGLVTLAYPEFAPAGLPSGNAPPDAPVFTPHDQKPDAKRKDRNSPVRMVLRAYHWMTEAKDFVNSLADALPKDAGCKNKPGLAMAVCVLENIEKIDPLKAVKNVIENEIEDRLVGRFNRQLQKLTNRKDWHGPSGMQLTEFGRQAKRVQGMVDFSNLGGL